jgi:hypothetical protein
MGRVPQSYRVWPFVALFMMWSMSLLSRKRADAVGSKLSLVCRGTWNARNCAPGNDGLSTNLRAQEKLLKIRTMVLESVAWVKIQCASAFSGGLNLSLIWLAGHQGSMHHPLQVWFRFYIFNKFNSLR